MSSTAGDERGLPSVFRDYLSMLKLRVVELLVITALGAMVPAAHGLPPWRAVIAVIVGGTLAAGGAESINAWFDRDIDAVMSRTRRRPIPSGRIPAWHALVLGILLNVVAFLVLLLLTNLLAATLALLGTLVYVFVYTMWLKRLTPQNIVIGGAAGAVPPLVGWAAVTGGLSWTAFALFLVIFFWTPPHFWSLAQIMKQDYREAGVPMMPSVSGDGPARRDSLIYATLAVIASLVPFWAGQEGVPYLVGALAVGGILIGLCAWNLVRGGITRQVWAYSMTYLAALFLILAVCSFFV